MEFEFNSNDGAPTLARGEGPEIVTPPCGPGYGEVAYTDDFFDYPAEISQRISLVSDELLCLRDALVVERECLKQESEEVAALTTLDEKVQKHVQVQAQVQANVRQFEYEDTASLYEPQESAYLQAEKRRQTQAILQKERYMKQMMEVEKMCSEEFFHLNNTRAKVDQLNREVSDWRLANGQSTGFHLYPMEIMRSPDHPCHTGGGGPCASIPGRFTINQMMTSAGIKSVPNVSLPVPDVMSMYTSPSFSREQPWVQTFAGAIRHAPKGPRDANWRSGDAEDRLPPVVHF